MEDFILYKIVIVGAGISGLSCAYYLQKLAITERPIAKRISISLTIVDSQLQAGGVIKTIRRDDSFIECGPESLYTEKPAAISLCAELGISNRIVNSSRINGSLLIADQGKLQSLPEGFISLAPTKLFPLIRSSLFSARGKLRMLCEPFIPGRKRALEEDDESVSQFVQRRLGGEVLHKVVQPLVGGIFNNDVSKLSARMCLSKAYALEERYGSIILGLIESQRLRLRTQLGNASTAIHSQFVTLDSGLQLLTDEVVRNLKNVELILGRNVESVYNISSSKSTGYRLALNDQTVLDADCLVFATPAPIASKLTKDLSPPLSLLLARINYASPVVINRIYAHKIAESLPKAFGFILPKSENSNLSACTLTSFKFPQFSGENKFLLRCFIGNEWYRKNVQRSDADIDRVIDTELAKYLGIKTPAEESLIIRHQAVSPQFSPGHLSLVKGIERELSLLGNVFVVGNAYNGSNISDCIERSRNTAEIIFSKIQKTPDLRLKNS